ncbi:MAG: T9SS type A sorting domain-containing protein [Bacteroidia bacterium]
MIKVLNAILVVSLFVACTKQKEVNIENPTSADFEIERLKDPKTGEVPSHLLYRLLNKRMGGFAYKTDKKYLNSWYAIDDHFASIAVSKLAYDPNNTNTYYFCTGEGWGNVGAQRGAGVWKSTDAGNTWTQLVSTADTNTFFYCQDMVVHPLNSHVYVATTRGLMRSENGGSSWEYVLGANNGSDRDACTDIEIAENGDLFASMGIFNAQAGQGSDGIYYSSTGDSGSWEKRMNGFSLSAYARIEIACAPSDSNVIYAIPERNPVGGNRNFIDGIYRSNNQGLNWFALATPNNDLSLANTQGWYDLIIKVDPNNANIAVAGGLHLWKTINGGQSWFRLTSGNRNGTTYPYVHVDQHEVIFRTSDTVYFTNDGGIYRSTNFTSPTPDFENLNQNYNTTQFYSSAIHPGASEQFVLGGTQDNGSNGSTESGISDFDRISGSDGGFSIVDFDNPNYVYTTTQRRRVYRNFQGTREEITNTNLVNDNTLWINPLSIDPNNAQRLYQASNIGIWRLDGARTATEFSWQRCTRAFGPVSAMDVSKTKPNLIVFGRSTNQIPYKVEDAHVTDENYTPISMDKNGDLPTGAYLNCIYIDPADEDHIILVYSNYGVESVFETHDGMANDPDWVSVEGNLPNIPIRWAVLHPDNPAVCYLATELGMYYTDKLDGDSTVWIKGNNSLANLRMDMIRVRESDNTFVIGSHGRGLYTGKTIPGSNDIQWIERGPSNVGGRTRTLMIDPNVPSGKKLWAGSVSGGLWSVNDIDSVNEFIIIAPPEDSIDYSLSIYPNPAWAFVYLEFDEDLEGERSVSIYNELGQLVKEEEFDLIQNRITYTVRDLSFGLYFFELKQGEETLVKKVVVNP